LFVRHFVCWVFSPLALWKIIMWKIESCSVNENTLIQNEGYEMFLNEVGCEDEVMEETQKNQSL
jgi:hypothetical protein